LGEDVATLRRPGWHIHDEHVDRKLPLEYQRAKVPIVFPSIHRSEAGRPALTVHPLGNPGSEAEVGGEPGRLNPTAPRLMADAFRKLAEAARPLGLEATFEATHHGPSLEVPSMFVEIGSGTEPDPPEAAVKALAAVVSHLTPDPGDRVAVAVGGGHYAPHFGELVLERRWAIGHILARHALDTMGAGIPSEAFRLSDDAEGWLMARAGDWGDRFASIAPRLREQEAPRRGAPPD
jgi:D-aminoacyl-tRNA deacylase